MRFASKGKALLSVVEAAGVFIHDGRGFEWLTRLCGRSRAIEILVIDINNYGLTRNLKMVISKKSQGLLMQDINKQFIAEQAKIFKALGHPSRLLMVNALKDGEKCVCDLRELVGDDMSTVSKHLSILKEAGVVLTDKRGTNIYYRVALPCLNNFLNCTSELIENRIAVQLSMMKSR